VISWSSFAAETSANLY